MKKKYLIIVSSLIAVIAISIAFFPVFRKLKLNYEHSMIEQKINRDFEEMIEFCEEHQKELEIYSNRYVGRYIETKHLDMPYEELKELERKVANDLDYAWLFDYISIGYTGEWEEEGEMILYRYKEEDIDYRYDIIEVLYVKEEMSEKKVEEMNFFWDPYFLKNIKKINAHLYVFIRGYECV